MSTKIKMIAMALFAMLGVTLSAQNLRIDKVEVRGREIKEGINDKGGKLYDMGVVMSGREDKDVCKITITNLSNKALELEVRRAGTIFFVKDGNVVNDHRYNETIKANGKMVVSFVCKRDDEHPMKKFNNIIIRSRINEQDEWTTSFMSQISYYGLSYERELAFLERDGKWGAMDINQKTVIPFEYERLGNFRDDYIKAKKNGNWGLIDRSNYNWVPFEYEELEYFSVVKAKKNGKWGVINYSNKVLVPFEYEDIGNAECKVFCSHDGYTPAKRNSKWGLIGEIGGYLSFEYGEVIPCEYDDIKARFSLGICQVGRNGKWGAIDNKNHIVIPIEYEEISEAFKFNESIYIDAKKNGKWGVIDSANHIIIPFEYEDYIYFKKDGCAVVKKNGKWGKVDQNNKIVTQFVYDVYKDVK